MSSMQLLDTWVYSPCEVHTVPAMFSYKQVLGHFCLSRCTPISGSFDLPSYAGHMIMDKLLLSSFNVFPNFMQDFKKCPAGSVTALCNCSLKILWINRIGHWNWQYWAITGKWKITAIQEQPFSRFLQNFCFEFQHDQSSLTSAKGCFQLWIRLHPTGNKKNPAPKPKFTHALCDEETFLCLVRW